MILILPLHHHVLESSDDVQLAFENAPSRPGGPGWYPAPLSSQAGHFGKEPVACPSQQAVSLPASRVASFVGVGAVSFPASRAMNFVGVGAVSLFASQATDFVGVGAVSLPASQATNLVGVDVAASVAQAQETWVLFQVTCAAGVERLDGVSIVCQKVDISSDSSPRRNKSLALLLLLLFLLLLRLLASAFSLLSHLYFGPNSSGVKRLETLLSSKSNI